METKNWTQVNIYNKSNNLLYSFILKTQNLLEVDAVMRGELFNQDFGSYAISHKWEDVKEDGTAPYFPCYGIDKPSIYNNGMSLKEDFSLKGCF